MRSITYIVFYAVAMSIAKNASSQDVPYLIRDGKSNTDYGGAVANNNDLSIRSKENIANTLTPQNCPAGQALTGAYYSKSGATVGGTCTTVIAAPVSVSTGAVAYWSSVSLSSTVWVGVPGSTVSWTSVGGDMNFVFNGECTPNQNNNTLTVGLLFDGALVGPEDATNGLIAMEVLNTRNAWPCSFNYTVHGVSAAVHKASVIIQVNGGAYTLCASTKCSFQANEIGTHL